MKYSNRLTINFLKETIIVADSPKSPRKGKKIDPQQTKALIDEMERKDQEILNLKAEISRMSFRNLDSSKELQFIKERLMNVEKMAGLGKMFVAMANELNNLLSGIIGYTQLLLANQDYPDSMRKELDIIQNQAHRTYRIIRGLLAFSHLQKIEREPVNINEILEYIVGLKKHYMMLDDIHVTCEFAPDLPEINGNPDSLHHLFMNIINNAHQALKSHSGKRALRISTRCEKGTINVSFEDTGPGVPKELQDRIFDPFFSTWGEKESLGLGLSTSYGIVSEHGGTIYYSDAPSGGARFVVELPCRRDVTTIRQPGRDKTELDAKLLSRGAPVSKAGRDLKHKQILIVDDEESVLTMLSEALKAEGFDVTATTDGQEAMSLIDRKDFDMIIADMKMPVVSGIHLYWFVEKKKPELLDKIVFVTGDIIDTTTRSFLKTVDNPYFTKPFDVNRFTAVIRNLI